jgi:D-serine deaminase-like pyridoxal phosphate-dependent protein
MRTIDEIGTPALLLEHGILERNLERMRAQLGRLGVALRPHVKTCKSIEVARLALAGQPGGITVSTLKEAEYFAAHGVRDILYAVGIAPGKLAGVANLRKRGIDVCVILDNAAAAAALIAGAEQLETVFPVLIEIDVDGQRAGIAPDGASLPELVRLLGESPRVELRGVMTHAGKSYDCRTAIELRDMAERERAGVVLAASRMSAAGFPATVISVGSTPTALAAETLEGVTEVRAGVYMFNDLVMAGIGVCSTDDIAMSVLVSVIGHQPDRGWIITDGGWMALSRDRGTAAQARDQGYGLVCDAAGAPVPEDMIVISASQEHGIIARRDGGSVNMGDYPVGRLLRILPNHACATAAQHAGYEVLANDGAVVATWPRINGW